MNAKPYVIVSTDAAAVLSRLIDRTIVGNGILRELLEETARDLLDQGVTPYEGNEIVEGRVWLGDAEAYAQSALGVAAEDHMTAMEGRNPELWRDHLRAAGGSGARRDVFAARAAEHERAAVEADGWLATDELATANHAAALRHPEKLREWCASGSSLPWLKYAGEVPRCR